MAGPPFKLPFSLRKYIREKKNSIRRQYGQGSSQEKKFLEWVAEKKREKLAKMDKTRESL